MTAVIQIGNSDDKLPQAEWAKYVDDVNKIINEWSTQVHFCGFSNSNTPWQNACWVVYVTEYQNNYLKEHLASCKLKYRQDAIAYLQGNTYFI